MQKVLAKYGLAAHLAFLAVAPLFLSPDSVFCLTGLAGIWLLVEPSRIRDEQLHDSRRRVLFALLKDPLFWVMLLVVAVEAVSWANNGIARRYDAETETWQLASAACPFLPGSVGDCAREPFACSCALLVTVMGCRHALGKSARLAFCLMSSMFAGGLAAYWVFQLGLRREDALAMARCAWQLPSYLGCLFGCQLLVGLVALVAAFEQKWRKVTLPLALSMGATSTGVFLFSPVWCQLAFAAALVTLAVYAFLYARYNLPGNGEFKFVVLLGISLAFGVLMTLFAMPEALLDERVSAWLSGTFFADGYRNLRQALDVMSAASWKIHPWLGGGLGSFALNLQFTATDAEWQVIPVGQLAPLNGYWYLLTEQGIVGALLIACPLGFLAWTYFWRLAHGVKHALPHPACWVGLVLTGIMLTDAQWDVTAFSPWMWLTLFPVFAISANSFPKERRDG